MLYLWLLGWLACIAASGVVFLIELRLIEAIDDAAKSIEKLRGGQQLGDTDDESPGDFTIEESESESDSATARFRSPVNV